MTDHTNPSKKVHEERIVPDVQPIMAPDGSSSSRAFEETRPVKSTFAREMKMESARLLFGTHF